MTGHLVPDQPACRGIAGVRPVRGGPDPPGGGRQPAVIGCPSAARLRDRHDREPHRQLPAGGLMFIDADLRALIVARFELVGTEETPGVPDTPAGLAAARSSALRELVRLIYDRSKFSPSAFAGERSSLALVVDAAEDHCC